jgi:hypothetical protein
MFYTTETEMKYKKFKYVMPTPVRSDTLYEYTGSLDKKILAAKIRFWFMLRDDEVVIRQNTIVIRDVVTVIFAPEQIKELQTTENTKAD